MMILDWQGKPTLSQMKILLSFPWLLYATTKGSSPSTPSKFLLFIVLLPFVDDPVSTLPEAIFLNKLVFLPYFYHLMISSSDLEMLI